MYSQFFTDRQNRLELGVIVKIIDKTDINFKPRRREAKKIFAIYCPGSSRDSAVYAMKIRENVLERDIS
jgi:hypothetical protein